MKGPIFWMRFSNRSQSMYSSLSQALAISRSVTPKTFILVSRSNSSGSTPSWRAQDDRLWARVAAPMLIDREDAHGIVGEDDLAEDHEVRLVFNDQILPALDRGLFRLLDFLSRAKIEPERVAQQHGTKPAFALERLEEPACVQILSIVLIEPRNQNGELQLVGLKLDLRQLQLSSETYPCSGLVRSFNVAVK